MMSRTRTSLLALTLLLPVTSMAGPSVIDIGPPAYFPTEDPVGGGGGITTPTTPGTGGTTGGGSTTGGGTATTATQTVADPWAGVTMVDCGVMRGKTCEQLSKVKMADIQQCIQRGYDPGLGCRPAEGANVSGASGFTLGGVAGPNQPPYKTSKTPSVPAWQINFSLKFPPWGSDEDKPGGSEPGEDGTCPELSDSTDVFGESVSLAGGKNYSLTCGGAVPLSSYPITLARNAIGFASTEYNNYYLWAYKQEGGVYKLIGGQPMALPQYLCTYNSKTRVMEKSLDLAPPRAQIIMYNSAMNALVLRMDTGDFESNGNLLEDESTKDPDFLESYLVIPISGGVPQVPANCASAADYYKHVARNGDIILDPNAEPPCEGADCDALGLSTTPTPGTSCETATSYPAGEIQTAAGPVQCTGKVQVMVVDRPNLVFEPAASISTKTIEGRTAVMTQSTAGSELYLNSQTAVTLPQSGQTFILTNGGTLGLKNNYRLDMKPSADINTGNGKVSLYGGGALRDSSGSTINEYGDKVAVTPDLGFPIKILPNGNINLPAGYDIPSQPKPYVQGPAGQ